MQLSLDSERTIDQLLDHINDMIGVIDVDGHLIRMNPSWQQHTGLDDDDCGVAFERWVAPSHVNDFRKTWADLKQGNQRRDVHLNLLTHYIGFLHVVGHFVPLAAETGGFSGAVAIFEPVTRLHQRNQAPFVAPTNTTDVIAVCDMDLCLQSWNHAAEEKYGWPSAQIAGKRFTELVTTRFVSSTFQSAMAEVIQSGYWSGETMQINRDGTEMRMMTTFSLVYDADKAASGIVIVNREISEQDAVITQLRLLTKAVESSHSAITIADATQPDMPLVYVNPAFERITGYPEREILGKNCRLLQGEDRDQPALDVIREALRKSKPCVVVLRNYRKDGTMFWNELRLTPMQDDFGTTTHFVGVATDITDRKIAEQRIRAQNDALIRTNHALDEARKQAEEVTRLKSEFLATMSHELLTPLHTIIGYTDIQLAGMTGELTDEQRNYLERVLRRAEHLLGLINDVLDLSRIEAGRIEVVRKPFSPKELLHSIVEKTTQLAQAKGLEMKYAIDEQLPDTMIGDAERLRQIAIHLLSNSIKFTESGYVQIRFRRHDPDTWTLSVSDTGIGIPAHLQEAIFDEFRQGDSSWRRQYGGTGLGLAIVRKLVLLMGGNIRVQSKIYSGSSFNVYLPLTENRWLS